MHVGEVGRFVFERPWGRFTPSAVVHGRVRKIYRARSGAVLAELVDGEKVQTVPVSKYGRWETGREQQ